MLALILANDVKKQALGQKVDDAFEVKSEQHLKEIHDSKLCLAASVESGRLRKQSARRLSMAHINTQESSRVHIRPKLGPSLPGCPMFCRNEILHTTNQTGLCAYFQP